MKNYSKFLFSSWFKFFVTGIYICAFYFAYTEFLNYHFEYAGYKILPNRDTNLLLQTVTFILCIIPCYFFNGIKQISSFLSIFIYFILYIPILITFFFSVEGNDLYVIYQETLFFTGMCAFFLADRLILKRVLILDVKFNLFKLLLLSTIAICILMLIIYRNNLKFVSFEQVYDQRSANEDLGKNIFVAYLSSWLSNVLIPICLGYSLFSKKRIYFIVGSLACIVIYMATAAKSVVLFPIITLGVFYLFKMTKLNLSFVLFGSVLSVLIIILANLDFNVVSSLILMRTIGNGGDLTIHYHDFFINNPNTYYSHINFVNAITMSYPYDRPLGFVIGREYWSEDMNANANFWATDGIAAFGDFGVVLVGFIMFMVFVLFNSISRNYNKLFLILILIPYIFSILNTSMFSSLLTGGAILTFLFLSFTGVKNNKFIKNDNINDSWR